VNRGRRGRGAPPGRRTEDAVGELVACRLFDERWYAFQTRRDFSSREEAVADYLHEGQFTVTPHPLFAPAWVFPGGEWSRWGSDPLSAYLRHPRRRRRRSTHPLVHLDRLIEADPAAIEDPRGPAEHWLDSLSETTLLPVPRGATPLAWGEFLSLVRATTAEPAAEPPAATIFGRISVVIPHGSAPWMARMALSVFREHPAHDVEVVLGSPDPGLERRLLLDVAAGTMATTVVDVATSTSQAEVLRSCLSSATGQHVVLVTEETSAPYWPWLVDLVAPLRDDADTIVTQPLLLDSERVVLSAGASFLDRRFGETPLLAGMAEADADRLGDGTVPGVGGVIALATDLAREIGPRPDVPAAHLLTDLALRAWRSRGGRARCVPSAKLVLTGDLRSGEPGPPIATTTPEGARDVWRRAGYDVLTDGAGRVTPTPRLLSAVEESPPRWRWTIDTSVTGGPWGETWGDAYFARSLARALERLGQHVTIDSRDSRSRVSRELDDVVLVLRGRDRVAAGQRPGHVMWVISHPADVTPQETDGYELVFAASESWAAVKSLQWGRPVIPLLQCTDPELFRPDFAESSEALPLLFVGNARGRVRPVVSAALSAGLEPAIVGGGWQGLVPEHLVVAAHVSNADLGVLYASAGVILNDHWDDMRREGFVANRIFDAVASGSKVVTDLVPADPILASAVRVWRTSDDVHALAREPDDLFPSAQVRFEAARHVVAAHSFEARARKLIDELALSRRRGGRG
jgi:hypothetical protein